MPYYLGGNLMPINVEFGSDNHSGVHPDIMKALIDVNKGYSIAYGEDGCTDSAIKKLKVVFGSDVVVFFVYNGTAANILGLKTVTNSFNSIICANSAHLNVHECCGPEKFIGCKLVTIPTKDGKLNPESIQPNLLGIGDVHMAQPKVISITQSTELGTTYTVDELKKLTRFAHNNNLLVHIDGARLCNAAVFLKKDLKEITKDVGVDILSFGGTKNGMMYGESVVFFDKKLTKDFIFYRKQGMQLTSKMRFISAQFNAFFENNLWKKNAQHANNMAQYLKKQIEKIPDVKVVQKVEANMVYTYIPKKYLQQLRKKYFFHVFDEDASVARLMCSFNTKKESIDELVNNLRKIL
jgi:threonine aldolase